MRELTKNEAKYVEIWLKTGSLVQAFIGAYNSKMTGAALRSSAKKIARRPCVKAVYNSRKAELTAVAQRIAEVAHGATVDTLLREYRHTAFGSMRNLIRFDREGQPHLDFSNATAEEVGAISHLSCDVLFGAEADAFGRVLAGTSAPGSTRFWILRWSIKLQDKLDALNAIGNHLGFFNRRVLRPRRRGAHRFALPKEPFKWPVG